MYMIYLFNGICKKSDSLIIENFVEENIQKGAFSKHVSLRTTVKFQRVFNCYNLN